VRFTLSRYFPYVVYLARLIQGQPIYYLTYSSRALRLLGPSQSRLRSRPETSKYSGTTEEPLHTVPLPCPWILVSSSRPTQSIPQGGRGKAYPSVSSSDDFTCRSDELQRNYTPSSLALIVDQEYSKLHETTRRTPCFSFKKNNAARQRPTNPASV
jgi:hypothetical protein